MMDYSQIGFEHSPAALVVLCYRTIKDANTAFVDLFGYDKNDIIDKSIATLFPTLDDFNKIGEMAIVGLKDLENGYYHDERFMQHKSGQVFWAHCTAFTLTPTDPFNLVICHFEKRLQNENPSTQLTNREREISHYVANGLTCKQIARILGLSPRTVEVHKANLMKKLGVKNKQQLLAKSLISTKNNESDS